MNNVQVKPGWLAMIRAEAEFAASRYRGSTSRAMFQADDFESVGNAAVAEMLAKHDPDGDDFDATLKLCVQRRIMDYVRSTLKTRTKHRVTCESPINPDGELIEATDCRNDPADLAEVRELAASLPTPAEVRVKALALKAAVLNAIGPESLTKIMRKQAEKAEAGDTRAARLILQVIGVSVASVDATDL
jgi:hypothetical protein